MSDFGAKVKLTVDKSGKQTFNKEIKNSIEKVELGDKLTISAANVEKIVADLQKLLNAKDKSIVVTIERFNANQAIKNIKAQLANMFKALSLENGVNVVGLKNFLGTGQIDTVRATRAAQLKDLTQLSSKITATYRSAISGDKKILDENELVDATHTYDLFMQRIQDLRKSRTALSDSQYNELKKIGVELQSHIKLVQKEQAEQEKLNKKIRDTEKEKSEPNTAQATQVATLQKRLERIINSNTKVSAFKERDAAAVLLNEINSGSNISEERLKAMTQETAKLETQLHSAGRAGKSFFTVVKNAYQKFGGWTLITRSLTAVIRNIKQMVTNVQALDTAMTELRKVTDETDSTYEQFFIKATQRAKEYGATISDTITATADFARLGYNINDSSELANAALVYKNVGDNIDNISDASQSIISTMRAFGIEAENSMGIVDKFNKVSNEFPISAKGIGDSLQRSASALNTAGNSIEESIAMITAANSVVQDTDVVGTAMKTVSMYLRAAKTEAEDAGESTEGMASSVSELRKELLSLTNNKVDIQIDNDTFKSTYKIFEELSAVWNDLTDISRAGILEKIGGKRNANTISALIENFDMAKEVVKSASNASGSALAENEKYLDSINGKISLYQASFEKLSATVVNSDFVKGVIDFGTNTLEMLNGITESLGTMPTLIAAITAAITAARAARGEGAGFLGFNEEGKFSIGNYPWKNLNESIFQESKLGRSNVEKILLNFNTGIKEAGENNGEFIKSISKGNHTVQKYLTSLKGEAGATFSNYEAWCKKAGVGVETLGIKSKVASIGVGLLNMALNTAISIGISMLISGIVSQIQAAGQAAEKAAEKAEELNQKLKELDDYKTQIANLQKELKDNNLSQSEAYDKRKELMSIQDELIEKYGDEAGAINNISAAIRGEVDALDAVAVAAANDWLKTDGNKGRDAQNFMNQTFNERFAWSKSFEQEKSNTKLVEESKKEFEKIKNELNDFFNYAGVDGNVNASYGVKNRQTPTGGTYITTPNETGTVSYEIKWDSKTRSELIKEYGKLLEDLQNYKSINPEVDLTFFEDELRKKYNEINDSNYQTQKSNYEQYGKYLAMTTGTYQSAYGKILKLQKDYDEAMSMDAGDSKNNKLNQIFQDVESLNEEVDGIDNVAVKDYLSGVITDFKTLSNMDKAQLELELNTNGVQDSVKGILNTLVDKNGEPLTDKGILDIGNKISLNDVGAKIPGTDIYINKQASAFQELKALADEANISIEEYINTLVKLGLVTQEVEPTPDFNISFYKERINNIVLYKPAQIGKTPEMDNPEGKSCMLNKCVNF